MPALPKLRASVAPLAGDVAAYEKQIVGIGGAVIDFEEEAFDVGMRHNAIDHSLADADNDGMLDFDEFCRLIRDREEGTHGEVSLRKRFTALDADGSGKVDMSEYLLWSLRDALIRSSQRVLDLFEEWDDDGSGTITKKELGRAVEAMGFTGFGKGAVDALFAELDGDGSGKVDYAELNEMLRKGVGSQHEGGGSGGTGRSPFVSPRSQAPKDRLGAAGNRRALKRNTAKVSGAAGRARGPLAGFMVVFDDGSSEEAGGPPAVHPVEQLRVALADNSSRVVDLFRAWDLDGDGLIDNDEWRQALFSLGVDETMRAQVDALFAAFDGDGSGAIEYKEMNRLLRKDATLDPSMLPGGGGDVVMSAKNKHAPRAVDTKAGRQRMGMQADLLQGITLGDDHVEGDGDDGGSGGGGGGGGGGWDETGGAAVIEVLRRSLARNWGQVRGLFRSWDTNGDGVISSHEFVDAMRVLGLTASDEALRRLFRVFDTDGSGFVDFRELDAKLKHRAAKTTLLSVSKHQRTLRPGRLAMPEWMEAMRPKPQELAPPAASPREGGGGRRRGGARPGPPPTLPLIKPMAESTRRHAAVPAPIPGAPLLPPLAAGRADRLMREKGDDLEWWRREIIQGGASGRPQRVPLLA